MTALPLLRPVRSSWVVRERTMLFAEPKLPDQLSLKASAERRSVLYDLVTEFGMAFPRIEFRIVAESKIINAQANRFGNSLSVSVYGGLAYHPLVGQNAIAFALLHETGHHLAPRPRPPWSSWLACECAADQWAVNEGATTLREKTGRRLEVPAALSELDFVVDSAWVSNDNCINCEPYASGRCWALSWVGRKASILGKCRLAEGTHCLL